MTGSCPDWSPIETAPKDGTHILALGSGSFGWVAGKWRRQQTVVHWWPTTGEEGFYTSVNECAPEHPFAATHWMPIPEEPNA